MNKLTDFLKAKALQIAIASISVCIVVGASAGAIIHSNNKKLETVLNELSSSSTTESVTESSSETTTESTTVITTTENKKSITTTTVTEPAGDRTIQYLAEYERITNEYEKKKADLEKEIVDVIVSTETIPNNASNEEKLSISAANSEALSNAALQVEKANKTREELDKLEAQYQNDIKNLKKEYGIID